jgi:hypothetical protein
MCIEPPLPRDRPPWRPVSHDALGIKPHDQHVAVVAIAGDLGVLAFFRGHGDAGDDSFLADIKVAEAADQAHAIHLAGLLLEATDQQHLAIGFELLFLGQLRYVGLRLGLGGHSLTRHRERSASEWICRRARIGHTTPS